MISSSSFCADDVEELSPLIFEAFRQVAEARGFTPDFLCSEEVRTMLQHYVRMGEDCLGIVLRDEKRVIVGGNFACHEGDSVFCVGPVFATKEAPPGTGRRVMHEIMDLTKAKGCRSLRLTQAGYNMVSLSLYIKMGFVVREHLSAVDVIALRHDLEIPSGTRARIATKKDIESMEKLCFASHGHVRRLDIRDTVEEGEAAVVEGPCGQVKGYCTSCGPEGHAVAESNDYLFAVIQFLARGLSKSDLKKKDGRIFCISSNTSFVKRLLEGGARIAESATLMSHGLYSNPALPSINSIGM